MEVIKDKIFLNVFLFNKYTGVIILNSNILIRSNCIDFFEGTEIPCYEGKHYSALELTTHI